MAAKWWPFIHAERAALIADLENISDAGWSTPSLCAGWTVRNVLAHMTDVAKLTPSRFVAKFAASGFRFNAMNETGMKAELGSDPAETLAGFRAQLDRTTSPPGGVDMLVGDMIIHSQDIRRPLEIAHTFQPEALTLMANSVVRSNLVLGGKRRSTGLKLTATDQDWTAGTGPEVKGPLASIIIVLTGREAGLPDLSGDGVSVLASRV
ncbi:MAG: maleylpyruvate isomerase family mycothiol-dependent enzyme [Candidatus Dormiibacterota bacterium]